MRFTQLAASFLLSLLASNVCAAASGDAEAQVEDPPALDVSISTSFPDAEVFGVKLVNGHPTRAILDFKNGEQSPVYVSFIGGVLFNPDGDVAVHNLSVSKYNVALASQGSVSLTYSFQTDMHPRDVRLSLVAVIRDANETFYTVQAYNETVSIVEAPTSIFDPQILFLYLVLASLFAGTCYFIYNTWITTLFPQKKRGGKGGQRAKTSSTGAKTVDPTDQIAVTGADGPAVTSGSKAYDESWIPAQHLQRPESKRVKSGTPKTKTRG